MAKSPDDVFCPMAAHPVCIARANHSDPPFMGPSADDNQFRKEDVGGRPAVGALATLTLTS